MSKRTLPPFRADHVGSLLRPAALLKAREDHKAGRIDAAALRAAEDSAIRDAVKLQEDLGYQAVTDGEFRRAYWHLDFLTGFDNVVLIPRKMAARFHSHSGEVEAQPPNTRVAGKLGHSHPIFVDHFKFVQSITKVMPKITIPSPSLMSFAGGREAVDPVAYPSMDDFHADLARVYSEEVRQLAAAGCRYLQIDETNFAYLCDPKIREAARGRGDDPDKLPRTYARLINDSVAGKPKDMVLGMHLCRGNFQSAWVAEGGYDPVAEILFNEVNVDGYFLEYDDDRSGDFRPLRFVPKGKLVVLGLVTTKLPQLESKDALKRRIDEAAKFCPLDQLCLSPQCGFSSTVEGNRMTLEDEIAKLRLVQEVAHEVWG